MNRQTYKLIYGMLRRTARGSYLATNDDGCKIHRDLVELFRHISGQFYIPSQRIFFDRRKTYTPNHAFTQWLKTYAPRQIPKCTDPAE